MTEYEKHHEGGNKKPEVKRKSHKPENKCSSGKNRSAPGKCNPGKITRNPFLNFLRKYRVQHCDWTVVKIAVEGAKVWMKLPENEKIKYRKEAAAAPKVPYKKRKHRPSTLAKKQARRAKQPKKKDRKVPEESTEGCKKKKRGFVKKIVEKVMNAMRRKKKRKK